MQVFEHTAYKKARKLSNIVWKVCKKWDINTQRLIGNQLIRSSDSISANLAEGWNRFSKKDKINFFIVSRASLAETNDWIGKAWERELIDQQSYQELDLLLNDLPKEINGLIKGTKQNLQK